MQRDYTLSVQKQVKSSPLGGKNCPAAALLQNPEDLRAYPHLAAAHAALSQEVHDHWAVNILDVEHFEMLEAELRNQAILSVEKGLAVTLSQLLSIETDFLRWRAKRFGVDTRQLRFAISAPFYIVYAAGEVISLLQTMASGDMPSETDVVPPARAPWRSIISSRESAAAQLDYLEQFAAYLNGSFSIHSNRYQQGLNLILEIIGSRADTPSRGKQIEVLLPTSLRSFLIALRELKGIKDRPGLDLLLAS